MPAPASRSIPKYSQVYSALRRDIESGRWREETKLPSEVDLVRQFGVSRITVTRAVRELQAAGLVQRVAGRVLRTGRAHALQGRGESRHPARARRGTDPGRAARSSGRALPPELAA